MTTLSAQEQQWNALIAEQAESAPGSFLQEGEVLNRGDGDVPGQMRVSALQYNGYAEVWHTRTGDKSLQPWYLLHQTMRKRFGDGARELVFTRTNPNIPPEYGEDLFCPLNPEAPVEERFEGRGFKPCTKRHIPHWDALQRHIRKSHGRAWDAMERDREDRERETDRALQRQNIESQGKFMQAMMQNAASPRPTAPVLAKVAVKACELCGQEFQAALPLAAAAKLKAHKKREHQEQKGS